MKFLCDQHRAAVSQCIHKAKRSWQHTLLNARNYADNENWQMALIYSGNSFEIAEIILLSQPCDKNIERYLQTSIELAHALRNCHSSSNALALYDMVFSQLNSLAGDMDIRTKMQPLKDVLFEPIDSVNLWMAKWHHLINAKPEQLH